MRTHEELQKLPSLGAQVGPWPPERHHAESSPVQSVPSSHCEPSSHYSAVSWIALPQNSVPSIMIIFSTTIDVTIGG